MNHPSHAALSREDAFLIQVSTLARQCARRLLILEEDEVEDIAQDIVLQCLASFRSGKGVVITSGIACFVRTMVLRQVIDAFRASMRRENRSAEYARELTERTHVWMSPELGVEEAEFETFLDRTIASLPPICRRVYVMIREDDASYETVGRTLGISRHTVHAHLKAAQRRFRAALLEQDLTSSACRPERSEEPALRRAPETLEPIDSAA